MCTCEITSGLGVTLRRRHRRGVLQLERGRVALCFLQRFQLGGQRCFCAQLGVAVGHCFPPFAFSPIQRFLCLLQRLAQLTQLPVLALAARGRLPLSLCHRRLVLLAQPLPLGFQLQLQGLRQLGLHLRPHRLQLVHVSRLRQLLRALARSRRILRRAERLQRCSRLLLGLGQLCTQRLRLRGASASDVPGERW